MKPVDCDQVFEILTSGPFPTGGPGDDAVETHLSDCAGCRRLAEALAPALDLIHESLSPDEAAGLPEYWGEHSSLMIESRREPVVAPIPLSLGPISAASAAELLRTEMLAAQSAVAATMAQYNTQPNAARPIPAVVLRWASLAALVLFAALAGRWSAVALNAGPKAVPVAAAGVGAPAHVDWAALGLVTACREPLGERLPLSGDSKRIVTASGAFAAHSSADVRCCTHCHAAGKPEAARSPSKVLLAQACVICHLSMQ